MAHLDRMVYSGGHLEPVLDRLVYTGGMRAARAAAAQRGAPQPQISYAEQNRRAQIVTAALALAAKKAEIEQQKASAAAGLEKLRKQEQERHARHLEHIAQARAQREAQLAAETAAAAAHAEEVATAHRRATHIRRELPLRLAELVESAQANEPSSAHTGRSVYWGEIKPEFSPDERYAPPIEHLSKALYVGRPNDPQKVVLRGPHTRHLEEALGRVQKRPPSGVERKRQEVAEHHHERMTALGLAESHRAPTNEPALDDIKERADQRLLLLTALLTPHHGKSISQAEINMRVNQLLSNKPKSDYTGLRTKDETLALLPMLEVEHAKGSTTKYLERALESAKHSAHTFLTSKGIPLSTEYKGHIEGHGIKMSKEAFVKEHEHLLKVLNSGSKAARKREANDQANELAHVMSGAGACGSKSAVAVEPDHEHELENVVIDMLLEVLHDEHTHSEEDVRERLTSVSTWATGEGMTHETLQRCVEKVYKMLNDEPQPHGGGGKGSKHQAAVAPAETPLEREIKSRFKDLLGNPEYYEIRNAAAKDRYWNYHSQPIYELGIDHGLRVAHINKLLEQAKKEMDPQHHGGGGAGSRHQAAVAPVPTTAQYHAAQAAEQAALLAAVPHDLAKHLKAQYKAIVDSDHNVDRRLQQLYDEGIAKGLRVRTLQRLFKKAKEEMDPGAVQRTNSR